MKQIGLKNNCKMVQNFTVRFLLLFPFSRLSFFYSFSWLHIGTFCGVFRRQALDRGAMLLKVDKIVTGL